MSTSLRERILAKNDRNFEVVTVPHWDVDVKVVGMSGRERARMLRAVTNRETGEIDFEMMYPMLIVATAHDPESGDKIFTDKDLEALNDKSGAVLEFLGNVASRLSGLEREAVDELGKPSSPDTLSSMETEGSPSTSP